MPLHLLLGLRTSVTPSVALQRRRTSPGISLKYRHCSFGLQMGPSVNRKPVQILSMTAFLSTSCSNSGVFTSTDMGKLSFRFVLLNFGGIVHVNQCGQAVLSVAANCQRKTRPPHAVCRETSAAEPISL